MLLMKRFIHIFLLYIVFCSSTPTWGMTTRGTSRILTRSTQLTQPTYRTLSSINRLPIPKNKELTPTIAHVRTLELDRIRMNKSSDDKWIPLYDFSEYKGDEKLNAFVKSLIRKELRGLKGPEEYYTYYHAHQWGADLAQKIYAALYPSKNKEFFPLYFLTLINPPDDEQALIQLLQKEGNAGRDSPTKSEKYLLSVNASFFGNSDDIYCSTAHYFSKDFSYRTPDLSLPTLFKHFGHPDLYSKYASEWKKVEALHAAASSHGKLWLIKIPKKIHSQVVIPTKVFGFKKKFVIDGKETDDVNLIQETLRTRPNAIKDIDRMQFRILMTPSTGLNPNLGIKTIPMNCSDPEKYAAFEKAFDVLMAKVKADILAQETSRAGINQGLKPVVANARSGITGLAQSLVQSRQARAQERSAITGQPIQELPTHTSSSTSTAEGRVVEDVD